MSDITVIGESVADAFVAAREPDADHLDLVVRPGGGPVNTAVALSRLGTSTTFLGRLSTGPFGALLRDHLLASGVDVSGCVSTTEPATLGITAIDAEGRAVYDFYADGTADWQWTSAELADRVPHNARCVHAGSLGLIQAPGGPLVEDLLASQRPRATISIDPNLRTRLVPEHSYRERLDRWTGLADIFRLSDEDLADLCPGASFEDVRGDWHDRGVRLAVLTRGPEGAVASLDGTLVSQPAAPVDAMDEAGDTVGAGDSFTAGMLHWLHTHALLGGRLEAVTVDDVQQALAFASAVAAFTCRTRGAVPPWAHELRTA